MHITAAVGKQINVNYLGASKSGHRDELDIEMANRNITVEEKTK